MPLEKHTQEKTLHPCRLQDSDTPTRWEGPNNFPGLGGYGVCR